MDTLTLADEIFELYRKLLSDLPPGVAALTRQRSRDPAGGEDIDVIPTNPNSAQISHHPTRRYNLQLHRAAHDH